KDLKSLRWEGRFCLPGTDGLILGGIFLGILSGILSCAPIAPQATTLSESVPSRSQDPGELVRSLAQRVHQFRSLRTLAKVYYWGPHGGGGFQEVILVHRPDRLRLETLSPLGATLIVTVDADEVVGFHPREGLFYRGRSSKGNLLRYTQIPLEVGEVTNLLMGLPPVEIQGRWEREGNSIHRDMGGGEREVVAFHPTLGIPTEWERYGPDGEIDFSALFSDFFSTPAGLFPLKISLEAHAQQKSLEISYQEPEVNVALPFALFVQEKPENAREILLESLGG
ncbi:MAG: hypothetical protein ACE5JO_06820, partial [Candidatus Binatia bacterium]